MRRFKFIYKQLNHRNNGEFELVGEMIKGEFNGSDWLYENGVGFVTEYDIFEDVLKILSVKTIETMINDFRTQDETSEILIKRNLDLAHALENHLRLRKINNVTSR